MKPRTLRYLLGVLALLVTIYAATAWLGGGGEGPETGSDLSRALAGVDTADLATVRIAGGGDSLRLRRRGDGWTVEEHPADPAAVADLQSSLADLEVTELASSNPDNHGRLGLAGGQTRWVELSGERWGPVVLEVGAAGPYAGSAYVRLEGSDRAWVLRGGLRGTTPTGLDAWRDPTVAVVDTSRLERLDLRRGDERLELRRSAEGWSSAPAEERPAARADSAAVAGILRELVRLRVPEFAPDSVEVRAPDRELTALSAEGDTLVHLRFEARPEGEGDGFWVTASGRDAVHALGARRADRLVPARSELLVPEQDPDDGA